MATRAPVQVPGAPVASPASSDHSETPAADHAAAAAVDDRDAEIEALRAQLRAEQAKNAPSSPLILEADGPNIRRHKAESKHLHLSAAELDAMVKSGEVKLTDHHVLCKDGWYVNPEANKQANG